ncbi:MAG: YdcF family protein, partial [Betaproteobacteria bacterium]
SGVLLLYCASAPFIAHPLFRYAENHAIKKSPQDVPRADAIVVLGGMLRTVEATGGTATEWSNPNRFYGGIELYKLGKAEKLIFTGGKLPWETDSITEGEKLRQFALAQGVPAKDIVVTSEVQNTEQEAAAVRDILKDGKTSVLLVTSAFHMPRARQLFLQQGLIVIEYPVDFKVSNREKTVLDLSPDPETLFLITTAIREQLGITFYWMKNIVRRR